MRVVILIGLLTISLMGCSPSKQDCVNVAGALNNLCGGRDECWNDVKAASKRAMEICGKSGGAY
jgi:hypothetical protein